MDDSLPRRALVGVSFAATDVGPDGLGVLDVEPGSMADAAGMRAGDRLCSLAGIEIRDLATLADAARRCAGSETATMRFRRGGSATTVDVRVVPYPLEACRALSVEHLTRDDGARLRLFVTGAEASVCVFYLAGIALESIEAGAQPALGAIIDELDRHGLATARLERRGLGDSEGGPAEAVDFDTETADAAAALAALAPRFEHVVVLGHSVGGMIAPIIGASVPVAVFATSARPWFECLDASSRRQQRDRGVEPQAIDAYLAERRALFAAGRSDDDRPVAFHAQLAAADLEAAWARRQAPALILWGDRDRVVSREESEAIGQLAGAPVIALPGLDHGGEPVPLAIARAVATWLDAILAP